MFKRRGRGARLKSLGYSTNSDIFQKRGDPWVSQKEGRKDYDREHEVFENPDLDRYTKATKAPKHKERPPEKKKPRVASHALKRKQIAVAMGAKLRKLPKGTYPSAAELKKKREGEED